MKLFYANACRQTSKKENCQVTRKTPRRRLKEDQMPADKDGSDINTLNIVEIELPSGRSLAIRINSIGPDALGSGASKVSFKVS
jgi:hypothetical protein